MPNEIDTLTQEVKDLTFQVELLHKQQKDLVDSINRENLNAQEAVETTNNILFQQAGEQKKLKDLQDKTVKAEKDLETAKANTDNIKKTNKDLEDYCVKLNADIKDLQYAIDNSTVEYSKKEADLKNEYKKSSESMKNDLMSIQLEINTSSSNLDLLKANLDSVNSKMQDAIVELQSKEEELVATTNTLNSALISVTEAETKLSELDKNIEISSNKVLSLESSIAELKQEQLTELDNLEVAKNNTEKQQAILDGIMVKGGSLLRREEYLSQQEIYLADQYKRLGLVYQPYAEN